MKKIVLIIVTLLLILPAVFAEGEVEVTLPGFDITLNGGLVENEKEPYPFIVYKGITYLPMTWDLSNALGLRTKWSNETGLEILPNTSATMYDNKVNGVNVIGKKYKAKVVDFPVKVNGSVIDNQTETYPLLNFKNVTYFPMTYKFMVTEFKSGYKYREETGLSISANDRLPVKYPETEVKSFLIDRKMLLEKELYINDYFKLEKISENLYFSLDFSNEEMDGKIVNVFMDFYDEDKHLFRESMKEGLPYKYYPNTKYWEGRGISHFQSWTKVQFSIEIVSKNYSMVLAKKFQEDNNVTVELIQSTEINDKLVAKDGLVYFDCQHEYATASDMVPSKNELAYAAIRTYKNYQDKDGNKIEVQKIVRGDQVVPDILSYKSVLKDISAYKSFEVDIRDHSTYINQVGGPHKEEQFYGNFVYMYDKDKELRKILIIEDSIK